MDTLTELRLIADDRAELGDNATAVLIRKAIDCFDRWEFEAGEMWLDKALKEQGKQEHPEAPPTTTRVHWRWHKWALKRPNSNNGARDSRTV